MKKLITSLKNKHRFGIIVLLGLSALLSMLLITGRILYSGSSTFLFLVWNLFLAAIPYIISSWMVLREDKEYRKSLFFILVALWLLFFPNAPYILTDLFHLKSGYSSPLWYDLSLILSFAWNGLILGYLSLMDIHWLIAKRYGHSWGWAIAVFSLILGSFGIYVGRFLRWNSWDILTSPLGLANDIAERLLYPWEHPRTYGVTLIFSAFLILGYLTLRYIQQQGFQRSEISV